MVYTKGSTDTIAKNLWLGDFIREINSSCTVYAMDMYDNSHCGLLVVQIYIFCFVNDETGEKIPKT